MPTSRFRQFLSNQDGTTAIEYALIVGLIFLAIVVAVTSYTTKVGAVYTKIGTAIDSVF